jgi:hypothetical protein
MTPEIVVARVLAIADESHDDEKAHGMEDDLRHEVLLWIANSGCSAEEATGLAKEVLKTSEIKFARWCA